jgi:hypothetical protein
VATMTVDARPTLRVGVTGHRNISRDGANAAAVQDGVRTVLAYLWQTVADSTPAGSVPALVVVSPLAEGADRLIAREAVANGFPLHCPLPFPRDEYERDFATEASRREFRDLLARAAFVRELPGVRGTAASEGAAYAAVGRVVVDESDVLLALWDGAAARGDGGTAHVVEDALARAVPVVWLESTHPNTIRLLTATGAARRADALSALGERIRRWVRAGRDEELRVNRAGQ